MQGVHVLRHLDVDITGDLQGSDDAKGAIVMFNQTNNRRQGALRENGAGYDYYEVLRGKLYWGRDTRDRRRLKP